MPEACPGSPSWKCHAMPIILKKWKTLWTLIHNCIGSHTNGLWVTVSWQGSLSEKFWGSGAQKYPAFWLDGSDLTRGPPLVCWRDMCTAPDPVPPMAATEVNDNARIRAQQLSSTQWLCPVLITVQYRPSYQQTWGRWLTMVGGEHSAVQYLEKVPLVPYPRQKHWWSSSLRGHRGFGPPP